MKPEYGIAFTCNESKLQVEEIWPINWEAKPKADWVIILSCGANIELTSVPSINFLNNKIQTKLI